MVETDRNIRTETYWTCASNRYWECEIEGSRGNVYIVTFSNYHKNKPIDCDFACTCPDYEFREHHLCKHIRKAMRYHCGWSQLHEGGEPKETDDLRYLCPVCSSSLEVEILKEKL